MHWWTGMQLNTIELMVYDLNIASYTISINHPGIKIGKVLPVQNPNYRFLELTISPGAKAGPVQITATKGKEKKTYSWLLKQRSGYQPKGLTPADVLYLLMPDRFANGDPSNDSPGGMQQTGINRSKFKFRHGGDLKGIQQKLPYLKELGITALWLNPVFENNQPYDSYHGYAVTDWYNIDARLGTREDYKSFVRDAHQLGIKNIKDVIFNHVGDQHWWLKDLPDENWIHQWDTLLRTSYRSPVLKDPYGAKSDFQQMMDGWFDFHMPDLNQQHPRLARYLIQNSIWWVEEMQLDGYRIDTYFYPDQQFMTQWNKALRKEYPAIAIFGETWVNDQAIQASFTEQPGKKDNTHLPAVTDFQVYFALLEALNKEQGWTEGVTKLYSTLAQDWLYHRPQLNVTFLDNHDLSRFVNVIDHDPEKWKSGLSLLLTTRGIPCLYYGTEIKMSGSGGGFGEGGRKDFPGGWPGDPQDKFSPQGRTPEEQEAFDFVKSLLQFRKNSPALTNGSMVQYIPVNGVYVYFRIHQKQQLMVIYNGASKQQLVSTKRYFDQFKDIKSARSIPDGKLIDDLTQLTLPAHGILILELKP